VQDLLFLDVTPPSMGLEVELIWSDLAGELVDSWFSISALAAIGPEHFPANALMLFSGLLVAFKPQDPGKHSECAHAELVYIAALCVFFSYLYSGTALWG